MKIICPKSVLAKGVNIVLKAVPSKTTMPILECILIDASTDVIKLTGNDMELGIETKVEGNILEKGKIALDAKLFSEITRKLSDGDSMVTIESDEKYNTTITCDNSVFRIQGKDGDEFSYLPYIEKNKYICLSQFTLKELIRQTIFSISVNDSNKMMTGELFEVNGDSLRVVSLDGHRMAIRKILLKDTYENTKVIVPGKTLNEISKILTGDNEKEVQIYFHKTGQDLMIGFNPKFLIDALRIIDDENVTLYMMNPKSPCFIKDEEETYIYLILPVNFNAAAV